jgi:ABC-type lipoprotein export system ATPase subunit
MLVEKPATFSTTNLTETGASTLRSKKMSKVWDGQQFHLVSDLTTKNNVTKTLLHCWIWFVCIKHTVSNTNARIDREFHSFP